MQAAVEFHPDVLLLDVAMPRLSGLDALVEITALAPAVKVILLTGGIENTEVLLALRSGVCGIVRKGASAGVLIRAVHRVMAGEYWVERELLTRWDRSSQLGANVEDEPMVTRREREVIRQALTGKTNDQIGAKLCISGQTVKRHLQNIYGKLGISGRMELAQLVNGPGFQDQG